MACKIGLPVPDLAIPSPFTLDATLPGAALDPTLCCKVLPFPIDVPPTPLNLPPAMLAQINEAIAIAREAILAELDKLAINCPLE